MPFISVCVPTNRVGGLDVLYAGLADQTFRDFELVLSDNIERRANDIYMFDACYGTLPDQSIVHVCPRGNAFPVASFCRTSNEALVRAHGEIVVFITDFTWLPPNTLDEHAKWHRANPAREAALMMPHEYRELPELAWRFKARGYQSGLASREQDNFEARRYADDVAGGILDEFHWSIFDNPMGPGDDPRETLAIHSIWGGADPKNRELAGSSSGNFFHAKNESVKLDVLLEANGWDESLDGTHAFQDSELAGRLTARFGVHWTLSHAAQAQIINPRTVFPFAERERDFMTNEMIWRRSQARGYADPVNEWSLLDARKELRRC